MPLNFSPSLTVASRLLHPYSTDNKISRLMVKRFFTERDTQRGSWSYIEKKQEEDRGGQEEKRRSQKGETNIASKQFPKCSPQP